MGRFVVLEGLDGAGTTTQSARLASRLRAVGLEVVETREPTAGAVGRLIRQTLRGESEGPAPTTLPWMFAADRADHLARVVEPALARGAWVVADRYRPSSLAYQSEDWPMDLVESLNQWFRAPDLLLFLDVPVADCLARIQARGEAREIFETEARLTAIAERYELALARLAARGGPQQRVDGTAPMDTVAAQVWTAVAPLVETR